MTRTAAGLKFVFLSFMCVSYTEPHSHHGDDHGHSHESEESHDHGHSHGTQSLPSLLLLTAVLYLSNSAHVSTLDLPPAQEPPTVT